MLEDTDLDAAVAAGIVTPAQAAALREIAASRTRERAISQGHEERFRFMSGFNDFFFAVGVVLFICGMWYFAGNRPIGLVVAAAVVWALAELLVAHLQLVLPGILLACFFVLFIMLAVPTDVAFSPIGPTPRNQSFLEQVRRNLTMHGAVALAIKAAVAAGAAGLYYLRFRLPFALLLLAATLLTVALSLFSAAMPGSSMWCGRSCCSAAVRLSSLPPWPSTSPIASD